MLKPEQMRLYAVTDHAWAETDAALLHQIEQAIAGGAAIVQLREKHRDKAGFLALAQAFVRLCREKGAVSIINDEVEIALACGADGVHIGQSDATIAHARALLGPDTLIGVSAHNPDEAVRAQAAGADYLGAGAAFATGTKADARPITRETLRAITAAVNLPVVAIGGVNAENITLLDHCGLAGVAVVSALFAQQDVCAAAQKLRALAESIARD